MTRFIQLTCLFAVLAGVAAGSASALAFADQDYFWPDGTVGEAYVKQLIGRTDLAPCTPQKCKYTLLAGELPPGLALHSVGIVDGSPTQLGIWHFWLQLHDCCGQTAEREFTINVNRIKLVVTTSALPVAIRNAAYGQALATSGGAGVKHWTLVNGTLPAGLTLNADGTITGTPTATGDSVFTVKVADDGPSTDTKQLLIRVVDPLAIAPLATRARVAEVGRPFSSTLAGTGGTQPYRWSVTGTLPAGLTLDGTTGGISGTRQTPSVTVIGTHGRRSARGASRSRRTCSLRHDPTLSFG